ncbi:hypothetical protein J22TS3_05530 [Paenibacillus sp. J22TS3]|nr:hypothetical protein J22TS3_05530 [Paenibacillus sp. J22TS3]
MVVRTLGIVAPLKGNLHKFILYMIIIPKSARGIELYIKGKVIEWAFDQGLAY